MPLQLDVTNTILAYEGTIKKFFRGCPKPDGWFGCFFEAKGLDKDIMIKGTYPKWQMNELKEGNKFNVILQKSEDNGYESYDIKAINLVPSMKHLATILKNAKGIGSTTVKKIVDEFGEDALNVIQNEPDRLKDVGISTSKIDVIKTTLENGTNILRLKVLELAPNLPISVIDSMLAESNAASKKGFNRLLELIQTKPYTLFIQYTDVTFRMADEIALAHGVDMFSIDRVAAAMYHVLHSEFRSFVYTDMGKNKYQFINNIVKLLNNTGAGNISHNFVETKLNELLVKPATLPEKLVYENNMLYELHKYRTERDVAYQIADMINSPTVLYYDAAEVDKYIDKFELIEGRKLDPYQREAVHAPFKNKVSVITGGPGRGKSSVAKCIIYVWEQLNQRQNHYYAPVQLCAPTGKACNRLSEATGRTNVNTAARLGCLYEFAVSHENTKRAREYLRNWTGNLVIVDESSMIGLDTAHTLLKVFKHSHILFMGDTQQLPSIEYGQFFKDLYDCPDVETSTLVINHRSTGIIVSNADAMNNGTHIEYTQLTNDDTFTFYHTDDETMSANWLIEKYVSLVQDSNYAKQRKNMIDTCILAPMRSRADGVSMLNVRLQGILNPNGFSIDALGRYVDAAKAIVAPRVHDRVIFTRNDPELGYINEVTNDEGLGISNGDCGVILSYDAVDNIVTILMDDNRRYDLTVMDCLDSVELAYAMTIHKSQGSEYKNVLISVQPALLHFGGDFGSKNLMYTAITRAKEKCIMYGSIHAMNKCIDTPIQPRNSQLLRLIDYELSVA